MEFEPKEVLEPVSPGGQYLKSSALSLTILGVLESQVPIDDVQVLSVIKDVFVPANARFSSIMVKDKKGRKKWRRVEVTFDDHVFIPIFPDEQSQEFYDECLDEYLSKIALDQLPETQPLWEVHIFRYPTSHAAGNIIFKVHHSLGDGYSLIGVLLSCLQRADDPSLPLTFPSRESSSRPGDDNGGGRSVKSLSRFLSRVINTGLDFGWGLLKSTVLQDDKTPVRTGDKGVEFRPISIATVEFSLQQIKQIKNKLKVTINDVITGTIMFGTRLYMQGERPESSVAKSTSLVLLNTRATGGYKSVAEMIKPNAEMPWGNRFAFLQIPIPKLTAEETSNPLDFVLQVHRLIKRKRNSAATHLIGRLLETLRKIKGPEATAKYIHSTLKNSSMTISNIIGPVEEMALANHPIRGLYNAVAGAPQNLAVTVLSYAGTMRLAVVVEKGFVDAKKVKSCIENSFDMMFKAAVQTISPTNS